MKNTCLVLVVNSVLTSALFLTKPLPEDARLNFTALGAKYGHKVEEHNVVTEDGYILTVFHIPGTEMPPVLLTHGIADTSDTFIIRGKRSLAITLANDGYDVWAANTRGNKYARRHVKLNPDKDSQFWDFSFHESGYYDLSATVDYVLQATGQNSLQSIAHSQGTSIHFVLASTRPEYNEKFKLFIALAPIAYLSNLIPPVSSVAEIGPVVNNVLLSLKIEELVPDKGLESNLLKLICNQGEISYDLCMRLIIFPFSGFDAKRLEPKFLPTIIGHYPAAVSRKALTHYMQIALSKRFAFYNYGYGPKNFHRYGYNVNPEYNLRLVTMRTAFFVGKNDRLSRVVDVEYLRTLLPNIVDYHLMKQNSWNHLDFIWSNDMSVTLFPHIMSLLEKYR